MKSFSELNYYEMLEIPANASDFDIRQAYKEMLSIYDEDSSATYSLFSTEERKQILESIECAFTTLISRKTRAEYDRILTQSDRVGKPEPDREKPVTGTGKGNSGDPVISYSKIEEKIEDSEIKDTTARILSKEMISGSDIKELREAMGVELKEVYEATRVTVSILQSLEEDDIERLPSGSYIKYLLKLYTGFLRIDSGKVIKGYLKNINEGLKTTS